MLRPNRLSVTLAPPVPATGSVSNEPGHMFSPTGPLPLAPAQSNQRSRPAPTRYPITQQEFEALQQLADQPTQGASRPEEKPTTEIVEDLGGTSGPPPAAPLPPGVLVAPPPPPVVVTSFPAIPSTAFSPPDCTVAAGSNHVMVAVNSSVALYDKTGVLQWGPITLDQWFTQEVNNHKIFDPRLVYDQYADRWVLLAAALGPEGTQDSRFLVSVSASSDPSGNWHNYALDASVDGNIGTNNWGDYPALGVDDNALYITANMFVFNGAFAYAKIRVIEKTGPYAGGAVTFTDIPHLLDSNGNAAFTVQPCHVFGAGPPAMYFVSSAFPSGDELSLWILTNPLDPNPMITGHTVPVDPYALPPQAEQGGGGNRIDSGDTRLQNAVFRDGSVWTALTTRQNWGEPTNRAALHWFQIDPTDPNGPALVQQGVYGAAGAHYFYPGLMPTVNGELLAVFGRSTPVEFAGAFVTGRAAGDTAGALRPSAPIQAGAANYTGIQRWGDYSGIGLDPVDGGLAWGYTGVAGVAGDWATAVGSYRI